MNFLKHYAAARAEAFKESTVILLCPCQFHSLALVNLPSALAQLTDTIYSSTAGSNDGIILPETL